MSCGSETLEIIACSKEEEEECSKVEEAYECDGKEKDVVQHGAALEEMGSELEEKGLKEWAWWDWDLEEETRGGELGWVCCPSWEGEVVPKNINVEEEEVGCYEEEVMWEDDVWHLKDIKEIPQP